MSVDLARIKWTYWTPSLISIVLTLSLVRDLLAGSIMLPLGSREIYQGVEEGQDLQAEWVAPAAKDGSSCRINTC